MVATVAPLPRSPLERTVSLPVREGEIRGDLTTVEGSLGTVVFAHGSGSGRRSPRNRYVASELHAVGIGTLLLDLLTEKEAPVDEVTREFRFDIPRLAQRLVDAIDWLARRPEAHRFGIGIYGASTGGAAALIAAAERPHAVRANVLRGARSDLAEAHARSVRAPTLFVVGELDTEVRALNDRTCAALSCPKDLVVVPGATHLFEEPGALEQVAQAARTWFLRYLPQAT